MAYVILNTDGTTLLTLADKKVDQTTTSLTLVGKNYAGYGEYLNNNFIKLLGNGASSNGNKPNKPLKGQLWYDTTFSQLRVWTSKQWKPVGGAIISSKNPSTGTEYSNTLADIWFHPDKKQLSIVDKDGIASLIAPAYPDEIGSHGWTLFDLNGEVLKVKDTDGNLQEVSILHNHGKVRGYMSNEKFDISTAPNYSSISTATTSTVKGLTIFGDINYTGKSVDRYLTMNVNLDRISTYTEALNIVHIPVQNQQIVQLLNSVFPVNAEVDDTISISNTVSTTISVSTETGVMVGSEVKVICEFSIPAPGGYQVRRFVAIGGAHPSWAVSPLVSTATGIVSVLYKV